MKYSLKSHPDIDATTFDQDDCHHDSSPCFPLRPSQRKCGRNLFQNLEQTTPMKTHSFPVIAFVVALTLSLNSAAIGHGGGGSGGGHCGGGGHGGGGGWHGGGGCGWHGGGRGYGCFGGYYGGWGGGYLGNPYDEFGYGYPGYDNEIPYSAPQSYSTLAYSSQNSGSIVSAVQRRLARTKYYRGAVDGQIGPRTRGAIGQYQSDHYLPVTGRIDKPLLRSLGIL
jgi:hypothetical protein